MQKDVRADESVSPCAGDERVDRVSLFEASTRVRCFSDHPLFCGRNVEERWLGYGGWRW